MDLSTGLWIYLEFRIPFFSRSVNEGCYDRSLRIRPPMGSQSQASAAYTKFLQYRVEEKIDVLREVQIARKTWDAMGRCTNAHLCVVIHTNMINHILYSLLSYIYLYFASCSLYHFILMYQLSDVHQKD